MYVKTCLVLFYSAVLSIHVAEPVHEIGVFNMTTTNLLTKMDNGTKSYWTIFFWLKLNQHLYTLKAMNYSRNQID